MCYNMLSVWFDKQSGISSQHEHFGIRHEYNLKHFKSLKIFSKLNLLQTRYKNARDAFIQVYRKSGINGLWRGATVNVQRAALVNLGDLTTYDTVKRTLITKFNFKDNFITHTMSRYELIIFSFVLLLFLRKFFF